MSNLRIKQRPWVGALVFALAIAGMAMFFQPIPTSAAPGDAPEMWDVETEDFNGDGQIDRIVVTYSEDIDGTTVLGSDYTVDGYLVSSASESSAGVVTIILEQSGAADTAAIPDVTETGSVWDMEGPQNESVGDQLLTAEDGAIPSMIAAETDDADGNGQIDTIDLTYSEDIDGSTVFPLDYTLSGGYLVADIDGVAGSVVTIVVSESGSPDTGTKPTVSAAGSVDDLATSPNSSNIGETQTSTDGAAPSIVAAETDDVDADGFIDRLYVTYSEDLSGASVNGGDYLIDTGGYDVDSASETSAGVVTIVLDEYVAPNYDTDATPAVQQLPVAADGQVSDIPGNWSIGDNFIWSDDGAAPAPIDVNYLDGYWDINDGTVDTVEVIFSENIDVESTYEDIDWTIPEGGDINMSDDTDWEFDGDTLFLEVDADVDETSTPDVAPSLSYTSGAGVLDSIMDDSMNPTVSFGPVDIDDNARPYLLSVTYLDGGVHNDGTTGFIDTIYATYTEEMKVNLCATASFTLDKGSFDVLFQGQIVPGICGYTEDDGTWSVYYAVNGVSAMRFQTGVDGFGGVEPTFAYISGSGNLTDEFVDPDSGNPNEAYDNQVSMEDGAGPKIYNGRTSDVDGDGLIDRVTVSLSEAPSDSLDLSDFGVQDGTYGWYDISNVAYANAGVEPKLVIDLDETDADAARYGDTNSVPEVYDYEDFADNSGNWSVGLTAASGDTAAPVICSRDEEGYCDMPNAYYWDQNLDGNVDRATVVFSEPVRDTDDEIDLEGDEIYIENDNDDSIYSVMDAETDGSEVVFTLDNETVWPDDERGDTGEPLYIYFNDGPQDQVEDYADILAYGGAGSFAWLADHARPAMGYAYYEDTDHNGYLDTLYLPFSEPLSPSYDTSDIYVQDLAESYDYSVDSVIFYGAYEGELTYDYTLQWNLAERDVWDTAVTPYVRMSDVGVIEDMAGIDDLVWDPGEGNYAPDEYDYANPVVTYTYPSNGASLRPTGADITVKFSEPMNEALLTHAMDYYFDPEPADFGGTAFNDSTVDGYTIMTVSFDEGWDDDEVVDLVFYATHARDLTTRPGDPNLLCENESNPDCDGGTDYLMTFTARNAGGGGGGGGGSPSTTPLIDLTSPTAGAALTGGTSKNVTWTLSGSGIDTVELRYSTNGGASTTLIANNIAKAGPYAWNVPSALSGNVTLYAYAVDSGKSVLDTDSVTLSVTSEVQAEEQAAEDSALGITRDAEGRRVAPGSGYMAPSPYDGSTEEVSSVQPGWFIRGFNYNTVYLVTDSGRRPFWDATTFMTWADDWDEIVWVTDATLATLTLGAPMLPQPGVVLVKISSDPKVYTVEYDAANPDDYLLRWITSETVASGMYGSAWADYIIDLEPTTMGRYNRGTDVTFIETVNTSIMETRMAIAAQVAAL